MTEDGRQGSSSKEFGQRHGWLDPYPIYADGELPSYVGSTTFLKTPLVATAEALADRSPDIAIVGAPFDDGVSHRPGARFGPRAIRQATYVVGTFPSLQHGLIQPLEIVDVVDAGDANIVPSWHSRGHAMIYRKVLEVAQAGAIPIVLGGDHSITWPAATAVVEARDPKSVGIVHFDAHADTVPSNWGQPESLSGHGTPMRRLIESGAIAGRNFVQVGLHGYWPDKDAFDWMLSQGMRWHFMSEIEERGPEAVIRTAIEEALDGPDLIYLSVDIDVLDPSAAPGTGAPEPGGLSARELLRAVRQIAGSVEIAGMDVVEVAPAYDHAEITATAANRVILEAIAAIAARRLDS